jgi:hypothetical protein
MARLETVGAGFTQAVQELSGDGFHLRRLEQVVVIAGDGPHVYAARSKASPPHLSFLDAQ